MTRRKREKVGLTNERDFPHLVELALPPGGFLRSPRRHGRAAAVALRGRAPWRF